MWSKQTVRLLNFSTVSHLVIDNVRQFDTRVWTHSSIVNVSTSLPLGCPLLKQWDCVAGAHLSSTFRATTIWLRCSPFSLQLACVRAISPCCQNPFQDQVVFYGSQTSLQGNIVLYYCQAPFHFRICFWHFAFLLHFKSQFEIYLRDLYMHNLDRKLVYNIEKKT